MVQGGEQKGLRTAPFSPRGGQAEAKGQRPKSSIRSPFSDRHLISLKVHTPIPKGRGIGAIPSPAKNWLIRS